MLAAPVTLFNDDNMTSLFNDDNLATSYNDDTYFWPPTETTSFYDHDDSTFAGDKPDGPPSSSIILIVGGFIFLILLMACCGKKSTVATTRTTSAGNEDVLVVQPPATGTPSAPEEESASSRIRKLPLGNVLQTEENDGATSSNLHACFPTTIRECGTHCPICLADYEHGDVVVRSRNSQCRHLYHQTCLAEWAKDHDDCPMCRQDYLVAAVSSRDVEMGEVHV